MISLDGITYAHVNVLEINRTADTLYKYAERSADGILHSELLGIYFNYEIKFANPINVTALAEYELFYNQLTQPVETHNIVIDGENNNLPFQIYVSNIKDALRRRINSTSWRKDLSVKFISTIPARTP